MLIMDKANIYEAAEHIYKININFKVEAHFCFDFFAYVPNSNHFPLAIVYNYFAEKHKLLCDM